VTSRRRPGRPRTLLRSILDAAGFLALLMMVLLGLSPSGVYGPDSGTFAVVDGDSLRKDGRDYRLHAIDAPELQQDCSDEGGNAYPCGREARSALQDVMGDGAIDCRTIDIDRYGRLVVECRAGEVEVNREMVSRGWAVAYVRHDTRYANEEVEARKARRGLWRGRFDVPEDWRRRRRDTITQSGMTGGDVPLPEVD
jgi:endonuclease YncB( thermonuclease family)